MATATATPPKAAASTAQVLPFRIGSRLSNRFSFSLGTTDLGTSSTFLSPIQIPAMGYLTKLQLIVSWTVTGGTTPALTADGPFNILSSVQLRNAAGSDLIVPVTGFQLFQINKYGCQGTDAPYSDPTMNPAYNSTVASGKFVIDVPCEISPADQFGAIPALASNRNYQLSVALAPLATAFTGSPTTVAVSVEGYAWYWTQPTAQTAAGLAQQVQPPFNGSLNLWQYEAVPITAGDKFVKSTNVGNVLRTLIFTLRDSSGVRDATDWPATTELILDNLSMFSWNTDVWVSMMGAKYGCKTKPGTSAAAQTLDNGVFVVPFFALSEGKAIANARRSQYLPTLDASQLQLRGTSFGSGASTLEILTNSVRPFNPAGNPAGALYNIS